MFVHFWKKRSIPWSRSIDRQIGLNRGTQPAARHRSGVVEAPGSRAYTGQTKFLKWAPSKRGPASSCASEKESWNFGVREKVNGDDDDYFLIFEESVGLIVNSEKWSTIKSGQHFHCDCFFQWKAASGLSKTESTLLVELSFLPKFHLSYIRKIYKFKK